MEITVRETTRNRAYSASITLVLSIVLFLILFYSNIITSNPPFENTNPFPEQQLAVAMLSASNEDFNLENSQLESFAESQEKQAAPKITSVLNAEPLNIKSITSHNSVLSEQASAEARQLSKTFIENKKNFSGAKNQAVSQSDTSGTDHLQQTGGLTETEIVGTRFSEKKYGVNLQGRKVLAAPKFLSDTKEAGIVVVEIIVNSQGIVIEANANGRGTNTSSETLKAKARQAAFTTKFNADTKFDEQRGTITFNFSFN